MGRVEGDEISREDPAESKREVRKPLAKCSRSGNREEGTTEREL